MKKINENEKTNTMKETTKKIGEYPTNARTCVNYPLNGKPTINFEYPDNKRQLKELWSSSGVMVISLVLTILTIIMTYFTFYSMYIYDIEDYPDCVILPNDWPPQNYTYNHTYNHTYSLTPNLSTSNSSIIYNNYNNISSLYFSCGQDGIWTLMWRNNPLYFKGEWYVSRVDLPLSNVFYIFLFAVFIIIFYFGGIHVYGRLVSRLMQRTNFGRKRYPGFNKFIHDKRFYAEFTECPDNLKIELPLFSNIYLNYDATGEFAEFLENVEIKEHDFKYIKRKSLGGGFFLGSLNVFKKFNIFKMKRKNADSTDSTDSTGSTTLVPNVFLWKATFTFRKKPLNGKLVLGWT